MLTVCCATMRCRSPARRMPVVERAPLHDIRQSNHLKQGGNASHSGMPLSSQGKTGHASMHRVLSICRHTPAAAVHTRASAQLGQLTARP